MRYTAQARRYSSEASLERPADRAASPRLVRDSAPEKKAEVYASEVPSLMLFYSKALLGGSWVDT
jgi:hypothetical protein